MSREPTIYYDQNNLPCQFWIDDNGRRYKTIKTTKENLCFPITDEEYEIINDSAYIDDEGVQRIRDEVHVPQEEEQKPSPSITDEEYDF